MTHLVPTHTKLTRAARVQTAAAGATGAGGLWGAAKNLLGRGVRFFSNLHPAAKALAIAGMAVVATNALIGARHEAAQRVT